MAKKKFYRPILYGIFIALRVLFRPLPFGWGSAFCGFVGRAAFSLLGREREKTLAHLATAFPQLSKSERFALGALAFRHYGYTVAELSQLEKWIRHFDRRFSVQGLEHLDRALGDRRGVIGVGAHFGNWELLAGYLALRGYPVSVVARKIYLEQYDRLLIGVRERMGVRTIYRDDSARDVLQALRQGRVVGFVADQDVDRVEGVFVEFFGRAAYTPTAPVRLAMKTGAPLLPFFIIREGIRHRIVIEPAVELDETGDKQADLSANTQKWVTIQEKMIQKYPHLWTWNHDRWKTVKSPISPLELVEKIPSI